MNKLSNIGFSISLFVLTAITPFNILHLSGSIYVFIANIALIALMAMFWIVSIRNLALHKCFVYFNEEEKEIVNGVDIGLVNEIMKGES